MLQEPTRPPCLIRLLKTVQNQECGSSLSVSTNQPIPEPLLPFAIGDQIKSLFPFHGRSREYLSFERGEELIIVGHKDDGMWFQARNTHGDEGMIPSNPYQYIKLQSYTSNMPPYYNISQRATDEDATSCYYGHRFFHTDVNGYYYPQLSSITTNCAHYTHANQSPHQNLQRSNSTAYYSSTAPSRVHGEMQYTAIHPRKQIQSNDSSSAQPSIIHSGIISTDLTSQMPPTPWIPQWISSPNYYKAIHHDTIAVEFNNFHPSEYVPETNVCYEPLNKSFQSGNGLLSSDVHGYRGLVQFRQEDLTKKAGFANQTLITCRGLKLISN